MALDGLWARKVMFPTLGGFLRNFRRLAKQMHSDARMINSMRPPAPMAMPAIVTGFKFVASGLRRVIAVELLPAALVGLALWLLAAGALKMVVEEVLNTGVLVVSNNGEVSALKVVVAVMIGVEEDCEMSAVLVSVKSVVTVPRSELVVPKSEEDVNGVIAEIVLVVRADVNAVVVAILRDKDRRRSVQFIFENVIGRMKETGHCSGNHNDMV